MSTPDRTPQNKTVLAFDLYGTILSTASISQALAKHFPQDIANGIAQTWRIQQLEYTWRLNSMGQYQPFSSVTRNSFSAALSIHHATLSPGETQNILDEYNNLHVFPEVPAALQAIQALPEFEKYIFTNGTDEMVQSSLKRSPEFGALTKIFKDFVTVEEVRAFKPDPAVYWHLLAKVGKRREQCREVWLVSGNAFDVVGARSIGLRACWVDREGKGWMDYCVQGARPDLIVRGLDEVVEGIRKLS